MDFLEECALRSAYQHRRCSEMLCTFGGSALFQDPPTRLAAMLLLDGVDHTKTPEIHGVNAEMAAYILEKIAAEEPAIDADLALCYTKELVKANAKTALGTIFRWATDVVENHGDLLRIRREIEGLFDILGIGAKP